MWGEKPAIDVSGFFFFFFFYKGLQSCVRELVKYDWANMDLSIKKYTE